MLVLIERRKVNSPEMPEIVTELLDLTRDHIVDSDATALPAQRRDRPRRLCSPVTSWPEALNHCLAVLCRGRAGCAASRPWLAAAWESSAVAASLSGVLVDA